jgi:hypothetical protein
MDAKLQTAVETLCAKQKPLPTDDVVLVIIARGQFSNDIASMAHDAIEQLRTELQAHGVFIIAEPGFISADP